MKKEKIEAQKKAQDTQKIYGKRKSRGESKLKSTEKTNPDKTETSDKRNNN